MREFWSVQTNVWFFFYLHNDVPNISPRATLAAPIILSSHSIHDMKKMDRSAILSPAPCGWNCGIMADQIFKVHSGSLGRQSALRETDGRRLAECVKWANKNNEGKDCFINNQEEETGVSAPFPVCQMTCPKHHVFSLPLKMSPVTFSQMFLAACSIKLHHLIPVTSCFLL